jgi:hypothetical protein
MWEDIYKCRVPTCLDHFSGLVVVALLSPHFALSIFTISDRVYCVCHTFFFLAEVLVYGKIRYLLKFLGRNIVLDSFCQFMSKLKEEMGTINYV